MPCVIASGTVSTRLSILEIYISEGNKEKEVQEEQFTYAHWNNSANNNNNCCGCADR